MSVFCKPVCGNFVHGPYNPPPPPPLPQSVQAVLDVLVPHKVKDVDLSIILALLSGDRAAVSAAWHAKAGDHAAGEIKTLLQGFGDLLSGIKKSGTGDEKLLLSNLLFRIADQAIAHGLSEDGNIYADILLNLKGHRSNEVKSEIEKCFSGMKAVPRWKDLDFDSILHKWSIDGNEYKDTKDNKTHDNTTNINKYNHHKTENVDKDGVVWYKNPLYDSNIQVPQFEAPPPIPGILQFCGSFQVDPDGGLSKEALDEIEKLLKPDSGVSALNIYDPQAKHYLTLLVDKGDIAIIDPYPVRRSTVLGKFKLEMDRPSPLATCLLDHIHAKFGIGAKLVNYKSESCGPDTIKNGNLDSLALNKDDEKIEPEQSSLGERLIDWLNTSNEMREGGVAMTDCTFINKGENSQDYKIIGPLHSKFERPVKLNSSQLNKHYVESSKKTSDTHSSGRPLMHKGVFSFSSKPEGGLEFPIERMKELLDAHNSTLNSATAAITMVELQHCSGVDGVPDQFYSILMTKKDVVVLRTKTGTTDDENKIDEIISNIRDIAGSKFTITKKVVELDNPESFGDGLSRQQRDWLAGLQDHPGIFGAYFHDHVTWQAGRRAIWEGDPAPKMTDKFLKEFLQRDWLSTKEVRQDVFYSEMKNIRKLANKIKKEKIEHKVS